MLGVDFYLTPQMTTTSGTEQIQSQDPAASFWASMWVQGPKNLSDTLLLSQCISRELDRKRSSYD